MVHTSFHFKVHHDHVEVNIKLPGFKQARVNLTVGAMLAGPHLYIFSHPLPPHDAGGTGPFGSVFYRPAAPPGGGLG